MADTYEAFYNGKPLNPNRGLPTMTYTQAEDCGLTESERLWCRTDGEDTPITADDIPYDSNTSVKDKIDTKAEIKRTYFNMNSTGQNALYIVTNNEKRIPVGLTITEFDTGYNRAFLSSIGGNVVLNAYKLDGTAYSGNLKGYYYFINDDWT